MQNLILKTKKMFISAFVITLITANFMSCKTAPEPKEESLIDLIKAGKSAELQERLNSSALNMKDEDGNSLLHIAAIQNDTMILRFLINMDANIEAKNNMGATPLAAALNNEAYDAVKVLIEYNANIFAQDNEGEKPFYTACKNNVPNLILSSQTLKQKDENHDTALHLAVKAIDKQLTEQILAIETTETKYNKEGLSPLGIAYKYNDFEVSAEIASMLLLAGIQPMGKNFSEFETASLARNYSMRFGDGETLLHIFARKGYTGFLKFLIKKNIPIDVKDASSSTALHEAVYNGNVEAALLLLQAGADPNSRNSSGNTALHLVMPEASRSKLVSELIKAGANPNLKDNYGETPLHIASRVGMNDEILDLLLKAGADINERNKKGQTPLILAIERNQTQQANFLINHGADIHAEDKSGESAFIHAVNIGLPMVQYVVTEKNSTDRDSTGSTPLHLAISRKASKDIIYYLIEKKSLINTRNKIGNAPLHIAAENNYREAGEILIANNADIFNSNLNGDSPLKFAMTLRGGREDWMINSHTIGAKDGAGNTPLHLVAEWQILPMIPYLIDKGADINARNANYETPLFNAVRADSPEAVKALLGDGVSKKADLDARDFLGNTVLHAAVRWSAYKSANFILSKNTEEHKRLINSKNLAGKTVLHEAAKQGEVKFINIFLKADIDINAADETGRSPLSEAVIANQIEAIDLLLQNGASPVQQDMYGKTPLHEAVDISEESITLIRNAGGNPLARDAYGKTPFVLALNKSTKTVDLVLGNDSLLTDTDGDTPLHIAVKERVKPEYFETVMKKRYPLNKRNKNGETAILLAVQNSQKELTRALLAGGADPFIVNNKGVSAITEIFTNNTDLAPAAAEFSLNQTDTLGEGILHYAAKFADAKTVKELLALPGINLDVKNTAGETPYRVALRWNRSEIADLLKTE
ncbi:ankyrin repeat domain-containing protein [Treponema sp. OMZ 787]|uniref:ankyrin repeat domain-containing protein n=1 Tax=Treponema sp. OMZ 787 TaxID=2563669 RepID=UPI0020A53743|nr:ankyrin repeat domain-containing protein [Treponema sp. OMZ 787]UTC62905.1 ankyrin repeat domain-containing protein [Treponema sp. OMZ 787]